MDSNDNSSNKDDSYGEDMDIKTEKCLTSGRDQIDAGPVKKVGCNMKMQIKQVPAVKHDENDIHTGDEEAADDYLGPDNDNDVEMKLLTDVNKNAGILKKESKQYTTITKSATDDTSNTTKSKETLNEIPSSKKSPPSLTGENDDKTQSSCISSPHASTPGSTPPSATVIATHLGHEPSPANSSGNTPPTDTSTPKHSPESIPQSPSSNIAPPSLSKNCIQQPINVVRNGTIPNAGKPLLSTMSKKLERSTKTTRSRKPKSSVAMYESEVSIKHNFETH